MRSIILTLLLVVSTAAAQSSSTPHPLTGTHFPDISDFPTLAQLGYDFALIGLDPSEESTWQPAFDAAEAAGIKLIVGGYPPPYTYSNGNWSITNRGQQMLKYFQSRSNLVLALYVYNEPYSTNPVTSAVTPCGYYSAAQLRALRTTIQNFWPGVKIYQDLGFPSDWAPGSAYTAENSCVGTKYADQTNVADYVGIWYYPFTAKGYDRANGISALTSEANFVLNSMKPAVPVTLNQAYACASCTDDGLVFPTPAQLLDWNCAMRQINFGAIDWYPWRKFSSYTEAIADVPSMWPLTTAGSCSPGMGAATVGLSSASGAPFVASNSFVSIYGSNLSPVVQPAVTEPLPLSLSGVAVQVTDSTGNVQTAPLEYVSSGIINFVMPPNIAPGQAAISVNSGSGPPQLGTALVLNVAPAIFSADGSGTGLAVAMALDVTSAGQTQTVAYQCGASGCTGVPISIADGQVYLILYGTGFRNHVNQVTCTINGIAQPVPYAGPQVTFEGLDQINIGPLTGLSGAGNVTIVLTVDGQTANSVTATFK